MTSEQADHSERNLGQIVERFEDAFGSCDEILDVDTTFVQEGGRDTLGLVVIVEEKLPLSLVPEAQRIPAMFEGLPVRVLEDEGDSIRGTGGRNTFHSTLRPGISISSRRSTNGTLGAIVFDMRDDGSPCILSNRHVLRGWLRSRRRRTRSIFQPGRLIAGRRRSNIVAHYSRGSAALDAAIARLSGSRPFSRETLETGFVLESYRDPKVGDILEKSGARTGVTRGRVVEVNGSNVTLKPVREGNPNNEEIGDGGDSGANWYYPGTSVGALLHHSGEGRGMTDRRSEFATGSLLSMVVHRLGISLTPP